MAQFAPWWPAPRATTLDLAAAAHAAGVLVEDGTYTVGTLDLGDDGPPIGIQVSGAVIAAAGETWLVYPGACRGDGWQAQAVSHRPGAVQPVTNLIPRQLGTADDHAENIVAALLDCGAVPSKVQYS